MCSVGLRRCQSTWFLVHGRQSKTGIIRVYFPMPIPSLLPISIFFPHCCNTNISHHDSHPSRHGNAIYYSHAEIFLPEDGTPPDNCFISTGPALSIGFAPHLSGRRLIRRFENRPRISRWTGALMAIIVGDRVAALRHSLLGHFGDMGSDNWWFPLRCVSPFSRMEMFNFP